MGWFDELFGIKATKEITGIQIRPKYRHEPKVGEKYSYLVEVTYDGKTWTQAPDDFRYRIYVGRPIKGGPLPIHRIKEDVALPQVLCRSLNNVVIVVTQPGQGPEFAVTFKGKGIYCVWVSHLNSNISRADVR